MQENIQIVTNWMKDVSATLGVDLTMDKEGICSFQVGEDTIITLEVSADFPEVYIYSPILQIPSDNKDEMMALLIKSLELNAFQAVTRGGAIAIAPGGTLLIFCYSTPIEGIDSEMFSNILGSFFEIVGQLKQLLSEYKKMPLKTPDNFFKI